MRLVKIFGVAGLVLSAGGCVGAALPSGTQVGGPPLPIAYGPLPPPPYYGPPPVYAPPPPPRRCYYRPGPFGDERVCRSDYY